MIYKNSKEMTTEEFWESLTKMHKEKYNRYSDGSFGGANKKRTRSRSI